MQVQNKTIQDKATIVAVDLVSEYKTKNRMKLILNLGTIFDAHTY